MKHDTWNAFRLVFSGETIPANPFPDRLRFPMIVPLSRLRTITFLAGLRPSGTVGVSSSSASGTSSGTAPIFTGVAARNRVAAGNVVIPVLWSPSRLEGVSSANIGSDWMRETRSSVAMLEGRENKNSDHVCDLTFFKFRSHFQHV